MTWKPTGMPMHLLAVTRLEADEWEALRLIDGRGKYHEDAAVSMGVSRSTITRLVRRTRRKIVQALERGEIIQITPRQQTEQGEKR